MSAPWVLVTVTQLLSKYNFPNPAIKFSFVVYRVARVVTTHHQSLQYFTKFSTKARSTKWWPTLHWTARCKFARMDSLAWTANRAFPIQRIVCLKNANTKPILNGSPFLFSRIRKRSSREGIGGSGSSKWWRLHLHDLRNQYFAILQHEPTHAWSPP